MIKIDAHQEVEEIVHQIDAFIDNLPEPLKSLGGEFASTGYPYHTAFLNNDLAFPGLLLPFWVAQKYETQVPDPVLFLQKARKMVRAALFGYLYIRIQDDVYDAKEGHDPAFLLLGNEFIRECFEIYQNLFSPASLFWNEFRNAWLDFSGATAWEIRECRGKIRGLKESDLFKVGQKLSFAKVPIMGVALEAGCATDGPILNKVADHLSVSSQLLNDFWSLDRDLKTHHFTFPFSSSLEEKDAFRNSDLDQLFFTRLLEKNSVEALLEKVVNLDQEVLDILKGFKIPFLKDFLEKRIQLVDEMKQKYLKIKLEALFLSA